MNKKHIRQDTLAAWNRISNKEEIEHAMYTRLFRLEIWQKANIIGITYSKESEWNTNVLINQAWQENKIITIPRTDFAYSTMQFYHYQHGDSLESRGMKIKEPLANCAKLVKKNEHDLIIIPGIVFDTKGYRIGYGGGFYDRYLREYQGQKLSLAASFQIKSTISKEKYDIPVDIIVTDFGTIYCSHT